MTSYLSNEFEETRSTKDIGSLAAAAKWVARVDMTDD